MQVILKEEEKERNNVLYIRSLHFLQSILRAISPAQGAEMASHYKEIVSLLLRILNKGISSCSISWCILIWCDHFNYQLSVNSWPILPVVDSSSHGNYGNYGTW